MSSLRMGQWPNSDDRPSHHHRKTNQTPIPYGAPGRFAPYEGPHVCKSLAGRWRPAHEFVGGRCLWCNKQEVTG